MVIKYYETVLLRIRERKDIYKTRLESGNAQSFEDYRSIVGNLRGLKEAEVILLDVYNILMNHKTTFFVDESQNDD